MPTLTIHSATETRRLTVDAGVSVRDALDATDLRVRAACGGTGACGACVIRLLAGDANTPTPSEYRHLDATERAAGLRLACQLRLRGDAELRLELPAPASPWQSIPPADLLPLADARPELAEHPYGVAVDLGTTHIRIALWDRQRGRRIATRRGLNPQSCFGADVLNRLAAAQATPARAAELARLAREAIVDALRDMLARDIGEVSPMLAEIGAVTIVGNTAMLALLTGRGHELLLDPAHWPAAIDCRPVDPEAWRRSWPLPHARIDLPAAVGGFIGADLLADLLATGLIDGPRGSLLIDVGTNTEIALWDGECLHVTATPGGPAFEGCGMRHGMSAEPGAIFRVEASAAGLRCHAIAGGSPRGFCGSGLVDAIALLLRTGRLKPSGRFADGGRELELCAGTPRSTLAAAGIDAFQRAKAAIAAAMAELLARSGLDWPDIPRLCVCGAFGRHLDIGHAQALGLLPPLALERIELFADASLGGCERALLAEDSAALFGPLAGLLRPINLSLAPGFEDRYIDHLRLRPAPGVSRA